MDLNERWLLFKEYIQKELKPDQYEGWLDQIELVKVSENKIIIAGISHPLFRDDIVNNHDKLFRRLLNDLYPENAPFNKKKIKYCVGAYQADQKPSIQTEFAFDEPLTEIPFEEESALPFNPDKAFSREESQKIIPIPSNSSSEIALFDPKHTLDALVIGDHNRLAYEAACRILHAPGTLYNPFYIYGNIGLGKTHLMEALGHAFSQLNAKVKVIYVTAESFLNDFVTHIQLKKMNQFRQRYRHGDVLMIDNIQNLSGIRSQEEMLHTIETLKKKGKQIIVTSNQLSSNMKDMDPALGSILESGLIVDIKNPDLESRMKILQSRAQRDQVRVPPEVCYYIAKHICSNVRKMEGALIRLGAHASLLRQEISLGFAETVLADLLETLQQTPTSALSDMPVDQIDKVFQKICTLSQVSRSELKSGGRASQVVRARQVSMFLLRKLTNMTLTEIGAHFGNRSHTAIKHSLDKIIKKMETDEALKLQVQRLIEDLSEETEEKQMKIPQLFLK